MQTNIEPSLQTWNDIVNSRKIKMSDLQLNIDYIANNIQQYIDDENFFDILDEDIIFQVLEKTTLDP